MPELVNKKSSGRSNMSGAHASSIKSSGVANTLKHNRGSIRKDNQLQTITLMPGPGVNQSVNIPLNQMKSLDYTENKSQKASISGSKRASNRSGGSRGTSAVSRGSKNRKL
jgi:hypothetical protein